MIRHIRDTCESKPKTLKGVCKEQASKPDETDHEGHEEGEEEEGEFTDDEEVTPGAASSSPNPSPSTSCKSTLPKQASINASPPIEPTPCRRFSRKGSIQEDDIQFICTGKSRDRVELDSLLQQIATLQLSQSGPFKGCF